MIDKLGSFPERFDEQEYNKPKIGKNGEALAYQKMAGADSSLVNEVSASFITSHHWLAATAGLESILR